MDKIIGSGNVFKDLGFDDIEAELLKQKTEAALRIRQAMALAGLSQAQLAKEINMSRPGLNRILSGNVSNVTMDKLYRIACGVGASAQFVVSPPKVRRRRSAAPKKDLPKGTLKSIEKQSGVKL